MVNFTWSWRSQPPLGPAPKAQRRAAPLGSLFVDSFPSYFWRAPVESSPPLDRLTMMEPSWMLSIRSNHSDVVVLVRSKMSWGSPPSWCGRKPHRPWWAGSRRARSAWECRPRWGLPWSSCWSWPCCRLGQALRWRALTWSRLRL